MRAWTVAGLVSVLALVSCGAPAPRTAYVGVMVDNHQLARPYQRGLGEAAWVEEQFAEGGITRFEAVYDAEKFPASVGPVRSVRSYFIDGVAPTVSAVFHAGGSPDALERLATGKDGVTSFNALKFDRFFAYDDVAPAPHHRFLTRAGFDALFARVESPTVAAYPFVRGTFAPDDDATTIAIDMHSPVHDVTYTFDRSSGTYVRRNRGVRQASMPANILVLETDVAVTGELGRLSIRMTGTGEALLFRDGGMEKGEWSKEEGEFFSFESEWERLFRFRDGQVWMIVLDDLDRVSWSAGN